MAKYDLSKTLTKEELGQLFRDLAEPFPAEKIKWRAGALVYDKGDKNKVIKAQALPYIDARDVMDRLDEIVGPAYWKNTIHVTESGNFVHTIAIKINGEWIEKSDGAAATNFEAFKGGVSDSLKRAGVGWGINRVLYAFDAVFVPAEGTAKRVKLLKYPELPDELLPEYQRGENNPTRKPEYQPKVARKSQRKTTTSTGKTQQKARGNGHKKNENPLQRALAYTVPEDLPLGGKTFKEIHTDPQGVVVLKYLAGDMPNPLTDKMFETETDAAKKLSAAAKYILDNTGK